MTNIQEMVKENATIYKELFWWFNNLWANRDTSVKFSFNFGTVYTSKKELNLRFTAPTSDKMSENSRLELTLKFVKNNIEMYIIYQDEVFKAGNKIIEYACEETGLIVRSGVRMPYTQVGYVDLLDNHPDGYGILGPTCFPYTTAQEAIIYVQNLVLTLRDWALNLTVNSKPKSLEADTYNKVDNILFLTKLLANNSMTNLRYKINTDNQSLDLNFNNKLHLQISKCTAYTYKVSILKQNSTFVADTKALIYTDTETGFVITSDDVFDLNSSSNILYLLGRKDFVFNDTKEVSNYINFKHLYEAYNYFTKVSQALVNWSNCAKEDLFNAGESVQNDPASTYFQEIATILDNYASNINYLKYKIDGDYAININFNDRLDCDFKIQALSKNKVKLLFKINKQSIPFTSIEYYAKNNFFIGIRNAIELVLPHNKLYLLGEGPKRKTKAYHIFISMDSLVEFLDKAITALIEFSLDPKINIKTKDTPALPVSKVSFLEELASVLELAFLETLSISDLEKIELKLQNSMDIKRKKLYDHILDSEKT